MAAIGTTALVIEIPAATVLLDVASKLRPELVRQGLPAHATVLYPFLPADELTKEEEQSVSDFAKESGATDLFLTEIIQREDFLAVAVPELQPVVDAACARWPQINPYGGRFGNRPDAHVTVAMGTHQNEEAELRREIEQQLPIQTRTEQLWLVELTARGWRPRLAAPFSG